jgi:general secretion pathway protein F
MGRTGPAVTGTAYSYRAARADGTVEVGTVDAATRDAASAMVATRGLWILDVAPANARQVHRRRRLPTSDLALGLRLLGSLLDAGLPMNRALGAFADVAPEAWAPALPSVQQAVREGQSLGAALAAAPVDVPAVVIGIVQAGESGSGVAPAVRRAAELTERAAATAAAVRGALVYPAILTAAGGASLVLLVGVVLPRFAGILADLGQTLPPTTRMVLDAAAIARAGAIPFAIAAAGGVAGWRAWVATDTGRARWHGWLLSLPVAGAVRRSAASARAASAIASLLESGVPITSALLAGARAAGDAALGQRIIAARAAVVAGAAPSRALDEHDALTPTAVRLARAGEESGTLGPMLARAAAMEADRAERLVRNAVRLLEPALILVFGGVVAFVAAALLQAVYSVRPG